MDEMRVRIEVEIFDELGDSKTLVGASQRLNASGNPCLFARKFDALVERLHKDIRDQIVRKHGDLS